jgi:O-Antigen ligase
MRDRSVAILLCALVAQIPFEIRYTVLGLTNLQWTFIVLAAVSAPVLLKNRTNLLRDRVTQLACLFVAIQWLAAAYAPEFHANTSKAAARFTAGLILLAIAKVFNKQEAIGRTWAISSTVAALYALIAYAGFGATSLFRTEEFYLGPIQRLSGSFEYPNTAAAYFAMSLPFVWWSSFRKAVKTLSAFIVWSAIILTFSKGALVAATLVLLVRRRSSVAILATGAMAYVVLLPTQPYLWERLRAPVDQNPIAAEYSVPWNRLDQQPATYDEVPLHIRNTGITKWRTGRWQTVAIGTRWWNPETQKFLRMTPLITRLPHDVAPGETLDVSAMIQTPEQIGRYILVLELFSNNLDWFSQAGVTPVLIEANLQIASARNVGQADLTSLYNRGATPGALTASVARSSLWSAALQMFRAHPFGVGPDNFRLEYGKYLNASHWDMDVHANNLYLELLTGSGFLGLAAFGLMLAARHWDFTPPSLATGIFLVHGLVDYFLMTTPLYFAFWMNLGTEKE